jgi:heat shock protein HslJ
MSTTASEAVVGIIEGTEINAVFGEDGSLSGSSGCNNYVTSYTAEGDQLTIGRVASTMMFCAEPEGVMEQEAAYLAALETAATFTIVNGQLELRTADGALAVSSTRWRPTPSSPGQPWQAPTRSCR